MRKAIFAIVVLFTAGNLFAVGCDQPFFKLIGIDGELSGPACMKGMDFMSAKIAGKTLQIVKRIDKASPVLFQSAITGKHFQEARLRNDLQHVEFLFKDLLISSITQNATPATETMTFSFSDVDVEGSGKADAVGREVTTFGGARLSPVSIAYVKGDGSAEQGATRWQVGFRSGVGAKTSLQFNPQKAGMVADPARSTPATMAKQTPTKNCVELRSGGSAIARYVFLGTVPPQGGDVAVQKMQLQIPPGSRCDFMDTNQPGQGNWNIGSNTAQ